MVLWTLDDIFYKVIFKYGGKIIIITVINIKDFIQDSDNIY